MANDLTAKKAIHCLNIQLISSYYWVVQPFSFLIFIALNWRINVSQSSTLLFFKYYSASWPGCESGWWKAMSLDDDKPNILLFLNSSYSKTHIVSLSNVQFSDKFSYNHSGLQDLPQQFGGLHFFLYIDLRTYAPLHQMLLNNSSLLQPAHPEKFWEMEIKNC